MPDEKVKKTSIEGEFSIPALRLKNLKWKTNFVPPTKEFRKDK